MIQTFRAFSVLYRFSYYIESLIKLYRIIFLTYIETITP